LDISGSVEYGALTVKELEAAHAGESDQIFDVSTPMLYINVSSQNVGANPCGRPIGQVQDLPLPRFIEMIHINYGRKRDHHGSFVDTLCLSAR
jgi:hypothetical protein